MSLLLPTGGLPLISGDPTARRPPPTRPAAPSTDDVLSQAPSAGDVASAGGTNVPGGTATSSSSS